jgi:hypothetical protein
MTDMPNRVRNVMGWLGWCALGLALIAPAVAADDAYQATVPVADTSPAARNDAFVKALDKVLARVAGHEVDAARANGKAATYVEQYHYQRAPEGASEPFVLRVRFAPSSIHHLIKTLSSRGMAANGSTVGGHDASAAPSYAGRSSGTVWVSNLHSALDFAGALAALRETPGVTAVGVEQARDDGALLELHTSMSLDQVLTRVTDAGAFADSGQARAGASAGLRWVK